MSPVDVHSGLPATILKAGYRGRRCNESLPTAAQSHHDALHDGLTGLGNRTLFTKQAELAIRDADRAENPLGLLLIDLNKFKEVNDTFGHHAGDLLLCQVAGQLRTACREVDLVARLGGDEFAMLLPGIGAMATRIHDALCAPVDIEGMRLQSARASGSRSIHHTGPPPANCSSTLTWRCMPPSAASTASPSISLLQELPVQEVKLDRGFVTQMGSDGTKRAIVRALLDLGHGFHLQVVAEGVEDLDTWTTLDSLGCDVIQGFYLGRPMPSAEFAPWLARHRTAAGGPIAANPATAVR